MPNISKITLPDGVTYNLVATGSDTKVTQNNTNADEAYRVLLSKSANNTTETDEVNKNTNFFYNPSKQALTVGSRMISTPIGTNSTSIGSGNEASGNCSFAEGYQTQASGDYSHTEGSGTTASNSYAHAEGAQTLASGHYAHAEGYYCGASGTSSHVEGHQCSASGNISHAQGKSTIANHQSQFTFGEYNIADDSAAATSDRGNYIEIVGNGTTPSLRSNARTLDWSGNQWIAGSYKSDALTASKLLVSDANKNITSSSLAVSDLITTSNIGSQSVNYATSAGSATSATSAESATQATYSQCLRSFQNGGDIYANNAYLLKSRYNKWSDGRFGLEIINNCSDTGSYGVRVDYASNSLQWNGIADDHGTLNTTDTWIPVYGSGKMQHTLRDVRNSTSYVDWNNTTTREYLATLRTLAFWNGAYASGGNSNLQYCDRGRFGTIVTKASDDVVGTYTDSTFYKVTHALTFKGSNNALVGGGKGNYVWAISAWSDSRLKKNIRDSQVNALDIINKIKMHKFDFKDEKYGHHEEIGYVAHELREIIPECVVDIPISEEEQKKYKTDTLMQVEDKHLIKYLVKAVQELSAEVERLKGGLKDEK